MYDERLNYKVRLYGHGYFEIGLRELVILIPSQAVYIK
jgi:hypothetical protein